jgi:hypothetical protein
MIFMGYEEVEFDFEELLGRRVLKNKRNADAMLKKDKSKSFLGRNAANTLVKANKRDIKAHEQDVRNIGSGTRCVSCSMLHFMWTPNCHCCGAPMNFNLGMDA